MSPAELDAGDVIAMAEGDREAFARLYDRHAPLLLALAERILRRRRDAEDLLHDVFVEVWERAQDYDPERGSVATWLRLRMRSRALDRLRAARELQQSSLEQPLESNPEGFADRGAVHRALAELPPEQREVLVLGYFDGLSAAEIAERIGVPPGTVKSRMAAALGKLRARLGIRMGGEREPQDDRR